jgi:Protein of unknown function (DUF3892)
VANFQIIGTRKPHAHSTVEHITHIAYFESFFNPRVIISVEEAIRRINNNNKEFYVVEKREVDYVEVVKPLEGKAFLKTTNRKTKKDFLMKLQEC